MEKNLVEKLEHQSDFAWLFYARDFKDQGSSRYEVAKYWEKRCKEAARLNFKDLKTWCEENLGTEDESGYIDTDFADGYIKDEFVAFNKRVLAAAVAYLGADEYERAERFIKALHDAGLTLLKVADQYKTENNYLVELVRRVA